MVQHAIDEITVGTETGVVNVLDVVSTQGVATLLGAAVLAARFIVAAVREQFVPDVATACYPHANVCAASTRNTIKH